MSDKQPSNQISIHVDPTYLPTESAPDEQRYVFAYTVTIENQGSVPAKLLGRRWTITDANGHIQEVQGDGVVGEQPYLKPGEGFQYTSGTMLHTPAGIMEGSYEMVTDDGENFLAEILPFTLTVAPQTLH